MNHPHPPRFFQQLFRWFCHPALLEELEGDLEERFYRDGEDKGLSYAKKVYRLEVLKLFRPSVIKKFSFNIFSPNTPDMFKNYFKVAWRNLLKNKGSSFVNILGLTIGLTGCILIALFVYDELQYDTFHPDGDRLYRAYTTRYGNNQGRVMASTSPQFGPVFEEEVPEIEESLRLFNIRSKQLFKKGDLEYYEDKGIIAEPTIFEFFHLPFLYGDPATALADHTSIVLTASLAEKYFGSENPIGQELTVSGDPMTVSAVIENPSRHFHLDFDFLAPFTHITRDVSTERVQSWVWQDFYNYFKVHPNTDEKQLEAKLMKIVEEQAHPQTKESGFYYAPHLQKVKDIHLHSANFRNDIAARSNHIYIKGLIAVGLFLLLIACINFINLTTAKAMQRAKEVGIRKTSGALRGQLALQFIGEATLVAAIAFLLSLGATTVLIPYLNDFTDKAISVSWFLDPLVAVILLAGILLTGLIAGAYPAFVISGFRPIEALRARYFNPAGKTDWIRKGLVVVQFGLTILLIICVLVISQQIELLSKKDLGFEKEQLLFFPMRGSMFNNFETVRAEFSNVPNVRSASINFGIPGDIIAGDNVIIPGENRRKQSARVFCVDEDYIPTMGMEIIAGRNFSKDISTDASHAFIVNETAISTYELGDKPEDVIDKPLEWEMWTDNDTIKKGRIIGVVKDFHYASLHEEVQPAILHIYPDAYWKVALRVDTDNMPETIAAIEKTWNGFDTGYPIDYQFVDEEYGKMYASEQKWKTLTWVATFLAIFIAGIGTFALAAYMTERRRKEIGIRRVLGASVSVIVGLLSRNFIWMIIIALLIASPLAWYLMNNWLSDFAYRVPIHWWIFPLAGLGAIVIALLTVGGHGLRAAMGNPVNSLRDE